MISYAVWLHYRFPLSLRVVEELLADHGVELIYQRVQRWSVRSGLGITRRIRYSALARGDKWHLEELVVLVNGKKHWLWRAVDQHGAVLNVLVQGRRDKHVTKRLIRKLLGKHGRAPRALITCKLKSYAAANRDLGLNVEHRQHKGLNNRAETSQQPTRLCEKVMRRFKSACHLQRFSSLHDQVANLFMDCRYNMNAQGKRSASMQAFEAWEGAI
ncbi:IS6 family transposase [Paraburkholderia aspalathi]